MLCPSDSSSEEGAVTVTGLDAGLVFGTVEEELLPILAARALARDKVL